MTEQITEADIAAIKTLNLRQEQVRMALAGFLSRGIKEYTNGAAFIHQRPLLKMLEMFITGTDMALDDAAKMFNAGMRPPP